MTASMKMNIFFRVAISLFFLATSFQAAANDINIGLFVSKQTHVAGETSPVLSVTAENNGPPVVQDIHIGVISPTGTIHEFPDWNTSLQPWLTDFAVPADLILPHTVITNLDTVPGGLSPGIWRAFFALTDPGTLNVNELQLVDFNIASSSSAGSTLGIVGINRLQSVSGTDVAAGGVFYQANTLFSDLAAQVQGQTPGIDQCVFNELFTEITSFTGFNIVTLDAGQLSVDNGTGGIVLDKKTEASFTVYEADPDPSLSYFDNASGFTFTGTGGPGAGPFSVMVPSVNPFNLLSPFPGTSFSINPGQNLVLSWENNNHGAGEVYATLSGVDITNITAPKVFSINCRFIDDGEGAIPANLLGQLKQAVPSGPVFPVDIPGDLPIDIPDLGSNLNLNIDRNNYRLFNTSGAPALTTGIAAVNSGAALRGKFQ